MLAAFRRIFALENAGPNAFALGFLAVLAVGSGLLVAATGELFPLGLPFLAILVWLAAVDFRKLFLLLIACIPFSTEVELPGGFGTDLPTEPLIIGLMLVALAFFFSSARRLDGRFLTHPITLLLFGHLAWMFLAALLSENGVVSTKFFAAKIWYVVVFYFLAGHFLKTEKDLRELLWWLLPGLLFTILFCTIKHATLGFEFKNVNKAMLPFYRNKVMYSCLLATVFPLLWMAARGSKKGSFAFRILVFAIILCLIGIQLSFTRAAYAVIILSGAMYLVIKKKWLAPVLLAFAGLIVLGVGWLVADDRFLDFAPEYETTVEHKKFGNLLEATYKLKDISTMERVYRWVAGFRMVAEKPFLGFGPGTFTFFYERWTVTSFQTYVSDNPERSGVHCYYLMCAAEQGVAGMLFFVALLTAGLLLGERLFHRVTGASDRRMMLSAWLALATIALLMGMNDLVETDKVGSFFFMCLAMMVNVDLRSHDENGD